MMQKSKPKLLTNNGLEYGEEWLLIAIMALLGYPIS